jgi:DNA-binding NarL/FixJ family response regulator
MTSISSSPSAGSAPHTQRKERERAHIRVLIVDDHPAVRAGLAGLLASHTDLTPVAAAGDADTALERAGELRPDLAVVDFHLGGRDGLFLCRALKSLPDPPRVLIFSAYADAFLMVGSVIAGADGILGKGVLGDELCDALRRVQRGEHPRLPLDRDVLEDVVLRLDPDDLPIFGMLIHDTPPADIAAALRLSEDALAARRSAMLERLRRRTRL